MKNNNRRNFIKNIGALGISIPFIVPISGFATEKELQETENQNRVDNNLPQTISILQTTDVH